MGKFTEELPSINSHNPLITWSHEILDLLYRRYSKTYGNQTWQKDDLLWEIPTHNFMQHIEAT